jgi:hypothetical protein
MTTTITTDKNLEEKCNFERDERNVLICEPIGVKKAQTDN